MSYVAILDSVGFEGKDGGRFWVGRGEELPDDLPSSELARLLDKEVFEPFGAIAKKGSAFADALSEPIRADQDPAVVAAQLRRLAEQDLLLVDPAGDPSDEVKTEVDAGVARSQGKDFSPLGKAAAAKSDKSASAKKKSDKSASAKK